MKVKVCLLVNEDIQSHVLWELALRKSDSIDYYDIINITDDNWLELIKKHSYDIFLLKPPGKTELFKRLFDERVYLIEKNFNAPIYPSLDEILIYENKRYLRDWLMINNLSHPKTNVFFNKEEAFTHISNITEFPIVGKTNIGASGNGVVILKGQAQTEDYVNNAFNKGIKPKSGPKLRKGSLVKKIKKVISSKSFIKQRLLDYKDDLLNIQYNYIILQEFIPHKWEWRCVRIGESFFAHKKIVKGEKASGTLIKGYEKVPLDLLNFIKEVSNKHNLDSVAIDVFEKDNKYFINEIQCFFGQSDPYQMLVDGKPGRYTYSDNSWCFEEGMFNTIESYDLRLEHALTKCKPV